MDKIIKKFILLCALFVDLLSLAYFIYIYFVQKVIEVENGVYQTNYQFWGLNQWRIVWHFAEIPVIIIVISTFTIITTQILCNKHTT